MFLELSQQTLLVQFATRYNTRTRNAQSKQQNGNLLVGLEGVRPENHVFSHVLDQFFSPAVMPCARMPPVIAQ